MSVKSRSSSPPQRTFTRSQIRWKIAGVAALFVVCLVIVTPTQANKAIDWINKTNIGLPRLPDKGFSLGLDLQGGAHLMYRAHTEQVPDADKGSAVEGVRDVIERRVRGGLGVSEPLVQTTRVGNDYRIIVELPGVTNVNQAIKSIGDTPVLEFKEENNTPSRDLTSEEMKQMADFNGAQEKKAIAAIKELRSGVSFATVTQKYSEDEMTKNKGGEAGFISSSTDPELYNWAKGQKNGAITQKSVLTATALVVAKRIGEQVGEKQVSASHLLICFKGTQGCAGTFTKEQAKAKIEDLKKQATINNFTDLVKKNSTEPGANKSGGDLGFFAAGTMVAPFEQAVWEAPINTIVGPVETPFGYHLIYKKGEKIIKDKGDQAVKQYHIAKIVFKIKQKIDFVATVQDWKSTGLSGSQLKRAEVTEDQRTGSMQVSLQFDAAGTKLFGELTTRNVGKQVAIYLDGQPISIPRVNNPITSGDAVITGNFSIAEAKLLAQRLNSGALPIPVEIISQQKVDATLGADSLAKSFKAGIAGLILVMIFMIIYYRLPGVLSVFSLAVYAVLNMAIFKTIGVTLTLAGIAGFILSIGMAVDANVLVFERLKEELRNGRGLRSALDESFLRAWPSIRDSHVTTLISCVLLIWFGSGFIQGFAVVLATGVLVSLFTAITVTRTIMRLVIPWFKEEANVLFLGHRAKGANNQKA